jgi:hypothetical protein
LEQLDCLSPHRYWTVQPLLKDETSICSGQGRDVPIHWFGLVVRFCFVPDECQEK